MRVERHLLEQRCANTLRGAAVNLPIDNHRIDQDAGVFHHHIIENFDAAGFRIDGNDRGMSGSRVHTGEPARRVSAGNFEPMRIDITGQIGWRQIKRARNVAQRHAAVGAEHAAVANLDGLDVGLQHRGSNRCHARRELLAGACGRAAGPDDAARAPGAA